MRVTLVALSMILLAAPVSAADTAAGQKQAGNGAPAKEKKYCVQYSDTTGTRVPVRECRTKAEWARDGVQVGKPSKS
jgi:hypothetical protein